MNLGCFQITISIEDGNYSRIHNRINDPTFYYSEKRLFWFVCFIYICAFMIFLWRNFKTGSKRKWMIQSLDQCSQIYFKRFF